MKNVLNDSVATRRKFNRENLILCGFMVSTFDPEKTLVSQNTVIHCFSEKKKNKILNQCCQFWKQRVLKKSMSASNWRKAKVFIGLVTLPFSVQFCWTQDSISSQCKSQVDSQYMSRKTSLGLSKGSFPLGCLRWSALMIASIFLSSTLLTVLSERWRYDHSL